MAAKMVNMANPDEDETLCATAEEQNVCFR